MEREEREFTSDGARWRAVPARRGRSGHTLVYFLPVEGDAVVDDDGRDRRAGLEPGRRLSDLDEDGLRTLLERGTRLTGTERRFRAPDGRLWLVQSVGPVWADDGVAEGLTGLVFTSLEGPPERLAAEGGHAGRMSPSDLSRSWRRAARQRGEWPSAPGDAGTTSRPED